MKVTIFGASGQTGILLVKQALVLGYEITAFVRNPAKLTIQHPKLTVFQGDVTDPVAVNRAVKDTESVISVLNTKVKAESKPITQGIKNIIAAMKQHGIRRMIMSSSGPVTNDPEDKPNFKYDFIECLVGFLVRTLLNASYMDIYESVRCAKASDLDWTVVRMPLPVTQPPSGKYNVGFVNQTTGLKISRANAAAFILDELQKGDYIRRTPVVFD